MLTGYNHHDSKPIPDKNKDKNISFIYLDL